MITDIEVPQISIIVPIHNAESYLKQCFDSILNQSFGLENIEVIMVNDGSTDSSPSIMADYTKKYSNFIPVHLDKSHGIAGFARNKGLDVASGKFLMFCDSDDCFDTKACELMYNKIIATKADMVTCNYQNMNYEGVKWDHPIFDKKEFKSWKLLSRGNYRKSFFVLCSSVCPKIFKRSFIEEHHIRFLEGVPGEDAFFTYSTLLNSNNIYYLDDVVYYYRNRNLKVGTKSVSWNCSTKYFEQINESYKAIYKLFKKADKLNYYKYFYAKNLTYMLYKFTDSVQLNRQERLSVLRNMSWFYELSQKLKVDPVQKSVKLLVHKIVEGNYSEAIDICNIIQEFRTYLSPDVRENMSKPKKIF